MSNDSIRSFIAIHLPPIVKNKISTYIENLKKISDDVRWIKAENIHLTLKFLGEIEAKRVDLVKKNLYSLSDQFSPFYLKISDSGCFPGKKRPRVFWLGMEQGKENPLFSIHRWIEEQLLKLAFEKEKRRFSPHLTLGRVRTKQPVDFADLFIFLEQNPFIPVEFQVDEIFLMQSFLKPTGAEYRNIENYPLKLKSSS
jgi:2'-5' RNA ligase